MLHKPLATEVSPPTRSGITLRKLCNNHLIRTKEKKEDRSHRVQLSNLKICSETFGHRDPATLKVYEVEEWLDQMDTWADSTRALFITIIKAVFNWAG